MERCAEALITQTCWFYLSIFEYLSGTSWCCKTGYNHLHPKIFFKLFLFHLLTPCLQIVQELWLNHAFMHSIIKNDFFLMYPSTSGYAKQPYFINYIQLLYLLTSVVMILATKSWIDCCGSNGVPSNDFQCSAVSFIAFQRKLF